VFRIVRIGFVLVCFVGLVWVGTQVKLGELTLYEHVRAISGSRESKDLVEGTKARVSEVGRLIGDDDTDEGKASNKPAQAKAPSHNAATPKAPSHDVVAGADKPAETVSDTDRKALKKMLESRK
jgi:hypothetical protein